MNRVHVIEGLAVEQPLAHSGAGTKCLVPMHNRPLTQHFFWGQRQNWNFTWTNLFPFAFCNFLHNREGVTFLRSTACVSTKQLRIKHVLPVNNNFQLKKKKKPALCGVGMSRFSPAFASAAVGLIMRLQSLGTRDFERSTQRSRQVDGRSRA